jgi:hypothetical protein
MVEKASTEEIS